jgi:hypothetical protein
MKCVPHQPSVLRLKGTGRPKISRFSAVVDETRLEWVKRDNADGITDRRRFGDFNAITKGEMVHRVI